MNDSHYTREMVCCPICGTQHWRKFSSQWRCEQGHVIPAHVGLPDFSAGKDIARQDRTLRDQLYNGLLGRYYNFMMPLLSMPARPVRQSLPQWAVFFAVWVLALAFFAVLTRSLIHGSTVVLTVQGIILLGTVLLCLRHPYLFWLWLLAIPVKISLALKPYRPAEIFPDVHKRWVEQFSTAKNLQVLDVSTGTCNSLLRHGWTRLQGEFHGVDLAATMLLQGADNAAQAQVPVQLYIADAQALPFPDACMDVVLNYGALNGYQDQGKALAEMSRVLKPGGVLVCLDEQLYEQATPLQARYFHRVLASHDRITHFPREAVPPSLKLEEFHQIYQFYFLAIMRKEAHS